MQINTEQQWIRESTDDKKSFIIIPQNLKADSEEEYQYYVSFVRMYYFSLVRILLMRRTITPYGKFIYGWELFRCLNALLSSIFFILSISGNFK